MLIATTRGEAFLWPRTAFSHMLSHLRLQDRRVSSLASSPCLSASLPLRLFLCSFLRPSELSLLCSLDLGPNHLFYCCFPHPGMPLDGEPHMVRCWVLALPCVCLQSLVGS